MYCWIQSWKSTYGTVLFLRFIKSTLWANTITVSCVCNGNLVQYRFRIRTSVAKKWLQKIKPQPPKKTETIPESIINHLIDDYFIIVTFLGVTLSSQKVEFWHPSRIIHYIVGYKFKKNSSLFLEYYIIMFYQMHDLGDSQEK